MRRVQIKRWFDSVKDKPLIVDTFAQPPELDPPITYDELKYIVHLAEEYSNYLNKHPEKIPDIRVG